MKEPLDKLFEQARMESANWVGSKPGTTVTYDELEKFAELIAQRCIEQCWTVSELESKGWVVSECSKRIRKHFGINDD